MYYESNTFVLVPKKVTFRKVLIKMQNTLQGDAQCALFTAISRQRCRKRPYNMGLYVS